MKLSNGQFLQGLLSLSLLKVKLVFLFLWNVFHSTSNEGMYSVFNRCVTLRKERKDATSRNVDRQILVRLISESKSLISIIQLHLPCLDFSRTSKEARCGGIVKLRFRHKRSTIAFCKYFSIQIVSLERNARSQLSFHFILLLSK